MHGSKTPRQWVSICIFTTKTSTCFFNHTWSTPYAIYTTCKVRFKWKPIDWHFRIWCYTRRMNLNLKHPLVRLSNYHRHTGGRHLHEIAISPTRSSILGQKSNGFVVILTNTEITNTHSFNENPSSVPNMCKLIRMALWYGIYRRLNARLIISIAKALELRQHCTKPSLCISGSRSISASLVNLDNA